MKNSAWTRRRRWQSRSKTLGRSALRLAGITALIGVPCAAQEAGADPRLRALQDISLEELLKTPVTTVTKRPEAYFQSPAAVHVIRGDEIRRSGSTTIPEALRLSPGVTVGQLTTSQWAVSTRGFADRYSDMQLVLMDGRTVYSPLFSGVNWSEHDYVLEDIEQIEVIRGPGGTLWGANAVNGVINIQTKDAADTLGWHTRAGGGTHERGFASARYGFSAGENGNMRVYGKYINRDSHPGGVDQWEGWRGGFRGDWATEPARFTLQGDVSYDDIGTRSIVPSYFPPYREFRAGHSQNLAGNILGRATIAVGDESEIVAQSYFYHTQSRNGSIGSFDQNQAIDLDLQHRLPLPGNQTFTYGMGYRYLPTRSDDNALFLWPANERHQQLFSAFVQDEIAFADDRLRLAIGSKLEHHDFAGWEVQPSGRLSWLPNEKHTVWTSVSRAVQVPGRNYRDLRAPLLASDPMFVPVAPGVLIPAFASGSGNVDVDSQELIAYELGYRVKLGQNAYADVAAFYNEYDNLVTGRVLVPEFNTVPYPHLLAPVMAANQGEATSYGIELSTEWRATDWCRFSAAYSLFRLDFKETVNALAAEDKDPRHQVSLRTSLDLPQHVTFDIWGRFVDSLPAIGVGSYVDLDLRLAWSPKPWLEMALTGQNLLESRREEFAFGTAGAAEVTPVPRGVYAEVVMRF
jgi:iron complex outermembrane receptor protein